MILSKRSLVALAAVVFISVSLLALTFLGSSDDSSTDKVVKRVVNLISKEDVDEELQNFIIDEYFGYEDTSEDREELRNVVELGAVFGFLRLPVEEGKFEIDNIRDATSDLLGYYRLKVEFPEQYYYLWIGHNNTEIKQIYLDDEKGGESQPGQFSKEDVGFEVIEELARQAADEQ